MPQSNRFAHNAGEVRGMGGRQRRCNSHRSQRRTPCELVADRRIRVLLQASSVLMHQSMVIDLKGGGMHDKQSKELIRL
jgi:hypothetical protein